MSKELKGNRLLRQIRRYGVLFALECMIALLLSYYCAYWLSLLTHFIEPQVAGLWGAISAAIVIDPTCRASLISGRARLIGTVMGVIVVLVCLYIFGYSIIAFGLSIFLAMIICNFLPYHEAYHGTLITVSVVFVVGDLLQKSTPIWFNALCRLLESFIGIVITLVVVICFYYLKKFLRLPEEYQ